MRWRVLFYVNENGKRPVEEFLRKLPPGHQGKAMRAIDLLEQFGVFLQRPHAAAIRSGKFAGLWELRIQFGGDASRIFFFTMTIALFCFTASLKRRMLCP